MADRRVVFASIEDAQIVRYERAKKWFYEGTGPICDPWTPHEHPIVDHTDGRLHERGCSAVVMRITVEHAAAVARQWLDMGDGWVYPGLPGGQQFDRLVNGG